LKSCRSLAINNPDPGPRIRREPRASPAALTTRSANRWFCVGNYGSAGQGESLRGIVAVLEAEGRRAKQGGRWHPKTVAAVVTRAAAGGRASASHR